MLNLLGAELVKAIPTAVGAIAALSGVWLTNFYSRKRSLTDTRREVYAKLLSASLLDTPRPDYVPALDLETDEHYEQRIEQWEQHRRQIRSLAGEVLLLTENVTLRERLSEYLGFVTTDNQLDDIEDLLRSEIF